ncbi:MAG: PfkB family carbohydrate kinase [Lentimicrobiaceae bacterium]|nr:PfkB family carbohydrate kinase [Lentimicrobiaceae bacterium]
MNTIIVGTVAYDKVETPFGKTDKILGGAATYISLAASLFTNNLHLISVIGGDFSDEYLEIFRKRKINMDGLQVIPDQKTFFWSGKYHHDMNNRDTLVTELNVLADFDPVLPKGVQSPDYVVLGNLTPSVQLKVLSQLKNKPKLTIMDTMNFWMDTAWDDLMKVIAKVDVLLVNDSEARQLSGEYSLVKAAQKILEMGPRYLIIKKGEHGAMLFDKENVFFSPAFPLDDVYDPTGAGDTFAGGFIGYVAYTDNTSFEYMKNALIYATALASFTVEKFGTEKLQEITIDDVMERVRLLNNFTQFDISLK